MKLRPVQLNKIEQILSDLERKVEEMEERTFNSYNSKDYITFDLGKDLQNLSYMLDVLREELKK
tara:strand:- start:235 stop:426 length:192 start_codon:yes stop_codon:yes gene_type:complete